MKLMEIISEMANEQQYKIEFISYRPEFDYLTKFNGHRISESRFRWCIGHYRSKIDEQKKEKSLKYWRGDEYKPIEFIVRKVGDKYIASFHDYSIIGKLIFDNIDNFSSQYHKDYLGI